MQENKLYVGNLSYTVTSEELRELFVPHGDVKTADIIPNKGIGFVEMGSREEAEKAIQALNGTEFAGRKIKVDIAQPPKPREEGSGGYGKKRW
ncbi:MAG: RNA-binding protein [Spirochaetes bacterium]|nr:RNA-binding protein [Spirochaetota bacterium]